MRWPSQIKLGMCNSLAFTLLSGEHANTRYTLNGNPNTAEGFTLTVTTQPVHDSLALSANYGIRKPRNKALHFVDNNGNVSLV